MRARCRRRDGQVPPPRQPRHLRHARAHGAAVLAAVPARRRAGQLRVCRRRSAGRRPLHGVPPGPAGNGDVARHRRQHGRLRAELRRIPAGAVGAAVTVPEPARERVFGNRGRHGDEHASASPRRDGRRDRRDDRQAGHRRRRRDEARQGPRLSDGSIHRRPLWDPRRLPYRPRPHRHACASSHRGAARRQVGDRDLRAAVRDQEGRRHRCDPQDRRSRAREGADRDLRSRRSLRSHRDAHPDRTEA